MANKESSLLNMSEFILKKTSRSWKSSPFSMIIQDRYGTNVGEIKPTAQNSRWYVNDEKITLFDSKDSSISVDFQDSFLKETVYHAWDDDEDILIGSMYSKYIGAGVSFKNSNHKTLLTTDAFGESYRANNQLGTVHYFENDNKRKIAKLVKNIQYVANDKAWKWNIPVYTIYFKIIDPDFYKKIIFGFFLSFFAAYPHIEFF